MVNHSSYAKHKLIQSDCYHESPTSDMNCQEEYFVHVCALHDRNDLDLIFKRIEASRLRFKDVVICCFNTNTTLSYLGKEVSMDV